MFVIRSVSFLFAFPKYSVTTGEIRMDTSKFGCSRISLLLRIVTSTFCSFCFMFGDCNLAAQDAAEVLSKRYDRSLFFGTIYEYDVDCVNVLAATPLSSLGPGVLRGRRVLTIGHFDSESYRIPIRIEHYGEQNEPYLEKGEALLYWEAFDGSETRTFNRSLFGNGGSRIEHECHVDAGAARLLLSEEPYMHCLFEGTSAGRHFGGVRQAEWKADPAKVMVKKEVDKLVGDVLIVTDTDSPYETVYSSGPEFFVVRSNYSDSKILALTPFEGIRYPSSGFVDPKMFQCTYSLRSVKPLPRDFDEWFTEWPHGSVVISSIDGSVKRIPYSDIESEKIRKFFDGGAVSDIDLSDRSRGYLFYINLVILVGIAVAVVMRISHRRKQQK